MSADEEALVLRCREGTWIAQDRSGGSYLGDESVASAVVGEAMELHLGVGADAPVVWLIQSGRGQR